MPERVVIITGAKGGLGTYVTETFLSAGTTVVGVSRSIRQADFPHPKFVAMAADLTKAAPARKLVQDVLAKFGRVDSLIHVMGGFAAGPLHEMDDAAWENMRDLNLTSAFNILREVLPPMRQFGYGRIVAVGSQAALEAHPGLAAYTTFKTALAALIGVVAIENNNHGITANVVLPGTMDTPANRAAMPNVDPASWVSPKAVAEVILSLSEHNSGHITGAMIPVLPQTAT